MVYTADEELLKFNLMSYLHAEQNTINTDP